MVGTHIVQSELRRAKGAQMALLCAFGPRDVYRMRLRSSRLDDWSCCPSGLRARRPSSKRADYLDELRERGVVRHRWPPGPVDIGGEYRAHDKRVPGRTYHIACARVLWPRRPPSRCMRDAVQMERRRASSNPLLTAAADDGDGSSMREDSWLGNHRARYRDRCFSIIANPPRSLVRSEMRRRAKARPNPLAWILFQINLPLNSWPEVSPNLT